MLKEHHDHLDLEVLTMQHVTLVDGQRIPRVRVGIFEDPSLKALEELGAVVEGYTLAGFVDFCGTYSLVIQDLLQYPVYLHQAVSSHGNPRLIVPYIPNTIIHPGYIHHIQSCIALLQRTDLRNKNIVDFGSDIGTLSWYGLLRGANHATMIEMEDGPIDDIQKIITLNSIDPSLITVRHRRIEDILIGELDAEIAVANLGNQTAYGGENGADCAVLAHIQAMQSVQKVVIAGYVFTKIEGAENTTRVTLDKYIAAGFRLTHTAHTTHHKLPSAERGYFAYLLER